MFDSLNRTFLTDAPEFGCCFEQWLLTTEVDDDLVDQIKAIGINFVLTFLNEVKYRFRPYWRAILAFETINPCAPYRTSPSAWMGVKDLVRRCTALVPEKVVKELKRQKDVAGDFSLGEIRLCKANVLKFYKDRKDHQIKVKDVVKFPNAKVFAILVFSVHVVSSVMETYFSKSGYANNRYRKSMRLELLNSTLHLQEVRPLTDNQALVTADERLELDLKRPCTSFEDDLDDLRKKFLHKRVGKGFFDEAVGRKHMYKGEVVDVDWSRDHGCYLFRIAYDSDSDEEDMERWEVLQQLVSDV